MNETIRNSRAASNSGGDFKPSVRPSRPFVTAKEAKYVVVPLVLLGSQLVSSCGGGPGPGEATPIAMETPRPLSDLVKEQSQAGIPFQGYNTGESRKSDMFILNQSSTYGEFKGSTVMIGLDADNSQIASEMFAFEKGVFVVFYNAEGKAVSEMSPVSINYGYDNNNNLSMIYKADLGNGEEGAENIVPFLTLTSNTSIDSLGADILAKAQAGDQETLMSLSQYFNDEGEVIALSYSNPQTHQQINVDNQSPNWGDKIKSVLAALNPFAATPVLAAQLETPTLVPTVEPTNTPAPTGLELQSMNLDQLETRYPELSALTDPNNPASAVSEFASALGIGAEEVGNLTPVLKTGPDGKSVLGLTDMNGYPVIIGIQQENGEWVWGKPMIKSITTVPFGSESLDGGNDPLKFDILRNVFNQWTVGSLSWRDSSPTEKELHLEVQEDYLKQAIDNNQPVNFMHLIYGNGDEVPDWLKNGDYSKEQLITMMQDHIREVMTKLRKVADRKGSDITITYTVANEGVNEPSIFWNRRVGPEYIQLAFEAARAADPKAVLIYNDYRHELPTMTKSQSVFELVQNLKNQGLIDGVGMQMHFLRGDNINPNLPIEELETGIRAQIDKYASIGLKTYITELDVDMSGITGTPQEKKEKTAAIYEMIARIAVTNENVMLVNTWGVNSESSWINYLDGHREPALLFTNDKPQLQYFAVMRALFNNLK